MGDLTPIIVIFNLHNFFIIASVILKKVKFRQIPNSRDQINYFKNLAIL